MLRCMRAMTEISWRSLSQSATVGREEGGGGGRTQSGVPMADVKPARGRRRRACRRIAEEMMDRGKVCTTT